MSLLEDSAGEALGSEFGGRSILSPVAMGDAMTIQDQYRHLKRVMSDDQELGRAIARSSQDQLSTIESQRHTEALNMEADVLAELNELDPFSDDFEQQAMQFNQVAGILPSVDRALDRQMGTRQAIGSTMSQLSGIGAEAGWTPEQLASEQRTSLDLLRQGDITGQGALIMRHQNMLKSKKALDLNKRIETETALRNETAQQEASLKQAQDARNAVTKYDAAVGKLDLPLGIVDSQAEWFTGDDKGNKDGLLDAVGKHIQESFLSSVIDPSAESIEVQFSGFPKFEKLLEDTGATTPQEVQDMFSGTGKFTDSDESAAAQQFLQGLAKDATGNKSRFLAKYANRAAGGTEDNRNNIKDFLTGVHENAKKFRDFSNLSEQNSKDMQKYTQAAQKAGATEATEKQQVKEQQNAQASDFVTDLLSTNLGI